MKSDPITNDKEHRQALQEIERLWNAIPGSAEEDQLEKLVTAVEAYEAQEFRGWDEEQTQG